jgi:hypothetical protein
MSGLRQLVLFRLTKFIITNIDSIKYYLCYLFDLLYGSDNELICNRFQQHFVTGYAIHF